VTCLRAFLSARKAAGALKHPAFPTPFGADRDSQLGRIVPRECEVVASWFSWRSEASSSDGTSLSRAVR
jgi:hypothetical protein